ncbi:MAG: family transcriptional regulator, regulator of sulfur utilization [Clostridiales bacterium]|nr:family transcriptional regulator, regulator of sulfur utilization [Clostridiales bacterium]
MTNMIGERLKAIRSTRQLSLEETAQITGVSKPMLSQIERGQSSPTINTLWKIATGLKVPLSQFLSEPGTVYEIIRFNAEKAFSEPVDKMRAYALFPFDPIRNLETFFIEFDPGCQRLSEAHMAGVEEYIFVFSGTLKLTFGEETVILKEKEAIRFRADIPHRYENPYDTPCTVHDMIFYPLKGDTYV